MALELTAFEEGMIVGLLIGEGSFGGDGRKPQITLRMHVRHESLLRWLEERVAGSRLYGPYHHGDRDYFQWMVRGPALTEDAAADPGAAASPGARRACRMRG